MLDDNLLSRADNCVYCALCSQFCPTYTRNLQELESPRGRVIAAIKTLNGELAPNAKFKQHIKSCLFCGACERACPANVPVIELLSKLKDEVKIKQAPTIRWFSKYPKMAGFLTRTGIIIKKLKFPLPKKYIKLLPDKAIRLKNFNSKSHHVFFAGCARNFDLAMEDIAKLLNLLGINLKIFNNCCGAIHAHSGDLKTANSMLNANLKNLQGVKKIIYVNPGCRDYMQQLASHDVKVLESCEFFATLDDFHQLELKPLKKTALVHIPCSQQYNLKAKAQLRRILEQIPDFKFKFLETRACCGASQTYSGFKDTSYYPQQTLAEMENPDFILSTNLACRLNLAPVAKNRQNNVKIMHPLSLINRQL